MDYLILKIVHVTSVAASYALFFMRGVWMMRESTLLRQPWAWIAPHVVDTVLLVSAVAIAVMSRQYPFATAWLTAKVLGLVAYIALGLIALRLGRTRRVRIGAWVAAQLVFFYIVAVAITRNPLPWQG